MSAHTPGPWRIEGWTNEFGELLDGGFDITAAIGDRQRMVVTARAPWPSRVAESNANARLIAEAPAMFTELQEIAELSDDAIDGGDPALFGSFRDVARAIVARIEGRS